MRGGPGRSPGRSLAAAAAALVLTVAGLPARAADIALDFTVHPLASFAIGDPARTRFGSLDFVGGFEVEADSRRFGGLSGLVMGPGGVRLLAITDDGLMLKAAVQRDEAGRPVGLTGGVMRQMVQLNGQPLAGKHYADSESLDVTVVDGREIAAVSFEQHPRVMEGPLEADGFIGRLKPIALPPSVQQLRPDKGLEAMAALPPGSGLDGRYVILGERPEYQATSDNQPGWVVGGGKAVAFRVLRRNGYDLTDAKVGPDGRLYVLERLFSLSEGVHARIRRLALSDLVEGAVVDGEVLFEADLSDQIDNMEGLAIWQRPDGETRLSLISDDNHFLLQRTLYLEFRLVTP